MSCNTKSLSILWKGYCGVPITAIFNMQPILKNTETHNKKVQYKPSDDLQHYRATLSKLIDTRVTDDTDHHHQHHHIFFYLLPKPKATPVNWMATAKICWTLLTVYYLFITKIINSIYYRNNHNPLWGTGFFFTVSNIMPHNEWIAMQVGP